MKNGIFPTKNADKIPTPEPALEPTIEQTNKSSLNLYEDFFSKIANDKTNANTEIFHEYFNYYNPWTLVKDFYNVNQTRNEKIVTQVNDALTDLGNAINKNENPKNENSDEETNIAEEILDFKKTTKR